VAPFAAPIAAIVGIGLLALYNFIVIGTGAIVGAFWQMVLLLFLVVPVSLVLSWPLFWVIQRTSRRTLPVLGYRLALFLFGAAFTVLLAVWYSTQAVGWLLAAIVVGLIVNSLAFMGSRSSSNHAIDSDTVRSPLRAPYGARHRGR
jgi:hypothetical protein